MRWTAQRRARSRGWQNITCGPPSSPVASIGSVGPRHREIAACREWLGRVSKRELLRHRDTPLVQPQPLVRFFTAIGARWRVRSATGATRVTSTYRTLRELARSSERSVRMVSSVMSPPGAMCGHARSACRAFCSSHVKAADECEVQYRERARAAPTAIARVRNCGAPEPAQETNPDGVAWKPPRGRCHPSASRGPVGCTPPHCPRAVVEPPRKGVGVPRRSAPRPAAGSRRAEDAAPAADG